MTTDQLQEYLALPSYLPLNRVEEVPKETEETQVGRETKVKLEDEEVLEVPEMTVLRYVQHLALHL